MKANSIAVANMSAQEARQYAESIVDTVREPLLVLDNRMHVVSANRSFYRQFQVPPQNTEGRLLFELGNRQWDIPELRHLLERVLPLHKTIEDFEVHHWFETIGEKHMLLNAHRLLRDKGKIGLILLAIEDITVRKRAEEALKKSESRFRGIFDNVAMGILQVDTNEHFVAANDYVLQMLGYSKEELFAMDVHHLTAPEDREKSDELNGKIHRKELRRVAYEKRYLKADGSKLWVSVTVSSIRDDKDRHIGSVTTVEDIAERKKVELALRESEARFRTMFESHGAVMLLIDPKRGDIVDANAAAESFYGYSRNELRGMRIQQINQLPPQQTASERHKAVEKNQNVFEFKHRISSGQVRTVEVYSSPIHFAGNVLLFSIIQDISERKAVETALRESEARLKRAQEIAHLGSWELDLATNRLTWSDEIYRIFGLQPQEFGATYEAFLDHVHPEDRAAVDNAYSGSIREGRDSYEIEHRVVREATGEIRYVHEKCQHMRDSQGQIVRSVGMVHDITDRKQVEVALRRRTNELAMVNRDLEAFSYSVSHDLRNPLHSIGGFTDFLLEDYSERLGEEGRDYLRRINEGVKRMEALIDDMLNLGRIGRQEMKREDVDLSAIVHSYLKELMSSSPQRQAKLAIQDRIHASADPRLIHLALENLLRNAWKFTSKKEVARIEFGASQQDGQFVYFIRDNGVGFDPQFAEKIFEPFKRLHAEREFGGTGVGLSIVQRVVGRHGGRVWAKGAPGKGATFYFTLPAETSNIRSEDRREGAMAEKMENGESG